MTTNIAITGACGFVGTALRDKFKKCTIIQRDDDEEEIRKKLKNIDVVINLAGAPIIKRWNTSHRVLLRKSRISRTKHLVNALNKSDVKHFISTSAIGIYPNDIMCSESCKKYSNDFLGNLVQDWEHEANKCNKPTTILRFGIILGEKGGALVKMLLPFKLGIGGNIDNGKMMMSWIHMDDLLDMYDFIIKKELIGIFNATSPNSVRKY